jgi:uncharacterized phage protein (TIGR01671 family)
VPGLEKIIDMREIKFRAWDGERMVFFDALTIGFKKSKKLIPQVYFAKDTFSGEVRLGSHEVMQYTGLKDKNEKEIYESDIIVDSFGHHWEVIFINGCFWLKRDNYRTTNQMFSWPDNCYPIFRVDHTQYSEIVGNIHQHKHLIL